MHDVAHYKISLRTLRSKFEYCRNLDICEGFVDCYGKTINLNERMEMGCCKTL